MSGGGVRSTKNDFCKPIFFIETNSNVWTFLSIPYLFGGYATDKNDVRPKKKKRNFIRTSQLSGQPCQNINLINFFSSCTSTFDFRTVVQFSISLTNETIILCFNVFYDIALTYSLPRRLVDWCTPRSYSFEHVSAFISASTVNFHFVSPRHCLIKMTLKTTQICMYLQKYD